VRLPKDEGDIILPPHRLLPPQRCKIIYDFPLFFEFFTPPRWRLLLSLILLALEEDGEDLTSRAIFSSTDHIEAHVVVKEEAVLSGLPVADIIMSMLSPNYSITYLSGEGEKVKGGREVLYIQGRARDVLKAERVILNILSHSCGVSTYTHKFVTILKHAGSSTTLLDTRKTLPGLRYLDKYSVGVGGGKNHRMNLEEMLMLKDTHIDRAGSIVKCVKEMRERYSPCPPIIVECRDVEEVLEAVSCGVDRILLDNMEPAKIKEALSLIPPSIETEISGGITLENISQYAQIGANYISVGALTKSAPPIDISMKITGLSHE